MADKLLPIQNMIYEIRGQKVMLDSDLARLYGVEIKVMNQAVKRNIGRFPSDFMFQLTEKEWKNLRSQIVTFSKDTRKYKPHAFTEHGILMLSSVLNSDRAININIQVMRIFVQMRQYALSNSGTNEQIAELQKLLMIHIENNDYKFSEYDETIKQIVIALNNLIEQLERK
ncbi:MAG: ORF6N domain-containing protein [Spirochaetes bacterium]|nr:ORF6N domain-containing protein [Spirochaetota bacterium]